MLWYITHTVIIIKWHHTNDLMAHGNHMGYMWWLNTGWAHGWNVQFKGSKLHGSSYSINFTVMQKQMMSCHSHMTSLWLKLGGPAESMREIISSAVSAVLSRSLPVAQRSESPAEKKQSKKRRSPSIVPSSFLNKGKQKAKYQTLYKDIPLAHKDIVCLPKTFSLHSWAGHKHPKGKVMCWTGPPWSCGKDSALFLHDWGWHAWGDFFCSNSLFANTAQEKGERRKRTSDQAWTWTEL